MRRFQIPGIRRRVLCCRNAAFYEFAAVKPRVSFSPLRPSGSTTRRTVFAAQSGLGAPARRQRSRNAQTPPIYRPSTPRCCPRCDPASPPRRSHVSKAPWLAASLGPDRTGRHHLLSVSISVCLIDHPLLRTSADASKPVEKDDPSNDRRSPCEARRQNGRSPSPVHP